MAKERLTRKELKHDGLVDAVSATALHFQKYRKVYVSLAAVAVIAAVLGGVLVYRQSSNREEAASLLNSARTPAALEEIVNRYPGTAAAPLALLSLANFFYRQGQFEVALGRYTFFLDQYPEHELAPFAQMGVAYCRESQGKWEDAIADYQQLERKYPGSSLAAESLFNVARCQLRLGRGSEAAVTYDLIINQYSQSAFAGLAREQLVMLSSGLSGDQPAPIQEAGVSNSGTGSVPPTASSPPASPAPTSGS